MCDSRFHTESIEELFEEAENRYGVVIVMGEEAEFYLFDDKNRHKFLGRTRHDISRNHHRGGQSQNRLARLRTEQVHRYVTQIEEHLKRFYTKNGVVTIKQLILSGPAAKKELVRDRLIESGFSCPIVLMSELDLEGIQSKFDDIVGHDEKVEAEKSITEIQEYIRTNPDMLVFGKENVKRQLDQNLLQKIWCCDRKEWQSDTAEIIQVTHYYLSDFGGSIGLRWYKLVNVTDEEE